MNLELKINYLPDELIKYIFEYVHPSEIVFVNKKYYLSYHSFVRQMIPRKNYENYIRETIKRDHSFVFEQIIKENWKKWLSIREYLYKNSVYSNYIYFLKDYGLINDSIKCRNLLNAFLFERGIGKNQHKKNIIKNIRN